MRPLYLWALLCLQVTYGHAHGDLHARIDTVTQLISLYPSDIDLYQRRGELYIKHENYTDALKDLTKCYKSGVRTDRLYLLMSLTHYHLGKFRQSAKLLDLISAAENDVDLLVLRGQVFIARKQYAQAAAAFKAAIDILHQPNAERYIEWCDALKKAGEERKALQVLDEGISKLGLVPVLYARLIDYLAESGQFMRAVLVQTKVIESQSRKEFALIDRARLWIMAGLPQCAFEDLNLAEQLIRNLSKTQLNQPRTNTLLQQLQLLRTEIQ